MQGRVMTMLADIEKFIEDDSVFDEFDQSLEKMNGILIINIKKAEMVEDPAVEIEDNTVEAC